MKIKRILIVSLMLLIVSLLVSCNSDYLKDTLTNNGIILTDDLRMVFSKQMIEWPSDGVKLSIYEYDNETSFFEQFVNKPDLGDENPLTGPFDNEKNVEFEDVVSLHISTIEIPDEYVLDWNINYSWKQVRGIYMIHFMDLKRLVVVAVIL